MNYEHYVQEIEGIANFLKGTRAFISESGADEMKETVIRYACKEGAKRLRDVVENMESKANG